MSKIEDRIIEVRSVRVLVDYELAELYQVDLKTLLQAVQRNSERFPSDFMFRLTTDEYIQLKRIRNVPTSHGGPTIATKCIHRARRGDALKCIEQQNGN